jgi:predicted transcriptional regulator
MDDKLWVKLKKWHLSKTLGWGYRSVVEHLPSLCKALGLIFSTIKKREREGEGRGRKKPFFLKNKCSNI